LTVDEKGLKVTARLLDTNSNRDIYQMVKANLLDKMSFAFTVKDQVWDRSGTSLNEELRQLKDSMMFRLSIHQPMKTHQFMPEV
jgi:HK97 family phage prohead protease